MIRHQKNTGRTGVFLMLKDIHYGYIIGLAVITQRASAAHRICEAAHNALPDR